MIIVHLFNKLKNNLIRDDFDISDILGAAMLILVISMIVGTFF